MVGWLYIGSEPGYTLVHKGSATQKALGTADLDLKLMKRNDPEIQGDERILNKPKKKSYPEMKTN